MIITRHDQTLAPDPSTVIIAYSSALVKKFRAALLIRL